MAGRKSVFVFHPGYYSDVGEHVLQTRKYQRTYERFRAETEVPEEFFFEPRPAALEEALLVHTREYVEDLLGCVHTPRTFASELPLSKEIVDSYFLAAGGTILACRLALERGRTLNLTGGFHHCFPDRAEGFCYLHDFAIGIRCLERNGKIHRTAVIDCDLHQGNGTAVIFARDPDVFTFSIHQENLYPLKQRSDLDIGLGDFDGDDVYLDHVTRAVPKILEDHLPDFVVYEAGADPYEGDQLGTLQVSKACLFERDRFVLGECAKRGIPVAGVLGGGYAADPEDTVEIHVNTCKAFWSA
ncbi:MAG: histone deacetylase [Candidatus Tectomicrobia bacterium]|nr:histone deacetylase [Candidatus Tectomicrobia bacterium]